MFNQPKDASIYGALKDLADLEFISRGGFKGVYKCKLKGVPQALKLIQMPPVPDGDEDAAEFRRVLIARVEREIELLGKCKTADIVKLGILPPTTLKIEDTETVVYSEELLDGPTLWELLRKKGPKPDEKEAKQLFVSLLRSIQEIWALKHIHRDIKPCNVIRLADPKRRFVLLDLGIAFSRVDTGLTAGDAMPLATYRYFAPEMANPDFRDSLDFRSDIYTAALSVFEYTAQAHPIAKDGDDQILSASRAVKQMPKSLKDFRPEFSTEFCGLIDQCLKKIPALRPANLPVLIRQLEAEL